MEIVKWIARLRLLLRIFVHKHYSYCHTRVILVTYAENRESSILEDWATNWYHFLKKTYVAAAPTHLPDHIDFCTLLFVCGVSGMYEWRVSEGWRGASWRCLEGVWKMSPWYLNVECGFKFVFWPKMFFTLYFSMDQKKIWTQQYFWTYNFF